MKILFNFPVMHTASELGPLALYFASQGHDVFALLNWHGPFADDFIAMLKKHKISAEKVDRRYSYGDQQQSSHNTMSTDSDLPSQQKNIAKQNIIQQIINKIKIIAHNLIQTPREILSNIIYLLRMKRSAIRTMKKIAPEIIITSNFSSIGQFDNFIVDYCNKNKIHSYCVPYTPYATDAVILFNKILNLKLGMYPNKYDAKASNINKLLAWFFPQWTTSDDLRVVFFSDPIYMLSSKLVGILQKNVWKVPAGNYRKIYVPIPLTQKMMVESGYAPEEIMVLSGSPRIDEAMVNLKNDDYISRIYAHLGLEKNQKFILWNIEPSAEHSYSEIDLHWDRFNSLVKALKTINHKVILSLHPVCDYQSYTFIEDDDQFTISTNYKINEIYPLSHIVLSYPSSTNYYSEIFKKPTVIYDWFGLTLKNSKSSRWFITENTVAGHTPSEVQRLLRLCVDQYINTNYTASVNDNACHTIYTDIISTKMQSVTGNTSGIISR